jgi:hypothetical protein
VHCPSVIWRTLRRSSNPRELSKTLVFPAVGPFVVTHVGPGRRTFKVRTAEGKFTVPADRIRKCPSPGDLREGMRLSQPVPTPFLDQPRGDEDMENFDEFVVDHILTHRRGEDGLMRLRLRWFGYGSSDDTWEPVLHVPKECCGGIYEEGVWTRPILQ